MGSLARTLDQRELHFDARCVRARQEMNEHHDPSEARAKIDEAIGCSNRCFANRSEDVVHGAREIRNGAAWKGHIVGHAFDSQKRIDPRVALVRRNGEELLEKRRTAWDHASSSVPSAASIALADS